MSKITILFISTLRNSFVILILLMIKGIFLFASRVNLKNIYLIIILFFISVTIISSIFMAVLFLSELHDYLTPSLNEELFVDTSRSAKLKINLDIVIPSISCDCK